MSVVLIGASNLAPRISDISRPESSESRVFHKARKWPSTKRLRRDINAAYRESRFPSTPSMVRPSTFSNRSSVSVVIDAREPDNQRWSVTRWTLAARAIEAIDSPAASLMAIARRTAGRAISIRFIIPRRALRRDGDCCHALPSPAQPCRAPPSLAVPGRAQPGLARPRSVKPPPTPSGWREYQAMPCPAWPRPAVPSPANPTKPHPRTPRRIARNSGGNPRRQPSSQRWSAASAQSQA